MKNLICEIETGHDQYLPKEFSHKLKWFNESHNVEVDESIKEALKRSRFEVKALQKSKKKVELKDHLYDDAHYLKVPDT